MGAFLCRNEKNEGEMVRKQLRNETALREKQIYEIIKMNTSVNLDKSNTQMQTTKYTHIELKTKCIKKLSVK